MKKVMGMLFPLLLSLFLSVSAIAGPYPPEAGQPGSTAIHMDDPAFVGWAAGYIDYIAGSNVDTTWQTPEKALGEAVGSSFDVVSLGRGGQITLIFAPPIKDGEGWDFAVFENSFSDTFLELAYVEVSSNGQDFVRFDSISLTPDPVGGFGNVDPTDIDGLAGKYRQGYGMPFDLQDLSGKAEVLSGEVNLDQIAYVKIIDIVGDGTYFDSSSHVIYDPYPTVSSAGFDLDAIGVSNGAPYPAGEYTPPSAPSYDGEAGFGGGGGCFVATVTCGLTQMALTILLLIAIAGLILLNRCYCH
jgi:hypothetical protein